MSAVVRLPAPEAQQDTLSQDQPQTLVSSQPPTVTPGDDNAAITPDTQSRTASAGPGTTGQIIAFLHVSGGAGATTLAVNVAACLNQGVGHKSCAILDFDLQFGSVASLLDLPRASTMQALIDEPARLDHIALDEMLTRHPSELFVLPATRVPLPMGSLQPATAGLLDAAQARFRYTIVDMPVALGPWSDIILSRATKIYLVTPMTVPAAHNLARFFFLLQQHELYLPISIVVNRHTKLAKQSLITPAEFNSAIGRTIEFIVPEDFPLVQQSVNQGTPAVTMAPKSPFARAVQEIVANQTGEATVAKHGLFGLM